MVGRSASRVTLAQVATRAGVGSATVDRVINERGQVSEAVCRRVLAAARELGLRRILPPPHRALVRLNVVLARPELPLIQRMGLEFRRLAQRMNHAIALHRTVLEDEAPATLAAALRRGNYDGRIVYAQDHPLIRAAIADLAAHGRPVVTLISDLPGSDRLAYAGTDHYRAGRTAGFFLGRMSPPGEVAVLCNHLGFQSHAERVRGLTDQLAEEGRGLAPGCVVEGGDDALRSESVLREAFRTHPGTVAVYNVGAGNRGVAGAIRAGVLARRPNFIGHELTPLTAALLREGLMTLAIDQSPELQAQFALEVLMSHFAVEGAGGLAPPYVANVPIVLYCASNLPGTAPPGG